MAEPGDIPVEIGWHPDSDEAALAFFPPEPLGPESAGALGPGGAGLARRLLQIRCPYDLRLRVSPAGPAQVRRIDEPGALSDGAFQGLVSLLEASAQRSPAHPVVQISLNFCLLSEERCALALLPPFLWPGMRDWPGTLVAGRFALRAWPRALNAALEWQERGRDWVLRRGDPLAYLSIAFDDPRKVPVPVEAATTPAFLRQYRRISGVVQYGRGVGAMFAEAEHRRPARLFEPKRTGTPRWDG